MSCSLRLGMKKMKTGNSKRFNISNIAPELIIILAVFLLNLYVALSPANSLMNWYNNDDGFYYFKVAKNIIGGAGVTFDGVNLANGFHPLWELICIPIFAIFRGDLILPLRAVVIVFGIFQSISLVFIYRYLSPRMPKLLSIFITLGFGLSWLVYSTTFTGGLESALSFLFIILLIYFGSQYRRKKNNTKPLIIIGIIAGLTVLSRLDNIIFVTFYGIWLIFDRIEDSNLLMIDALASILIVTSSAVMRVGYSIYSIEKTILAAAILFAVIGVISHLVVGYYSTCLLKKNLNILVRIFLSSGMTILGATAGCFVLFSLGMIEIFPRSILLFSGAGWLIYTVVRGLTINRIYSVNRMDVDTPQPLFRIFAKWIRKPLAYFLPVLMLVGAYMIWSQLVFGTPMPVSGQIKHWWGSLGNTIYGSPLHTLAGVRSYFFGSDAPFAYLYSLITLILSWLQVRDFVYGITAWALVFIVYILFLILRQKNHVAGWMNYLAIAPLGAGTIYRVLYFYISGYVHMRSWYWTIETILVFLILAGIAGIVWDFGSQRKIIHVGLNVIAGISLLITAVVMVRNLANLYPWNISPETAESYLIIPRMVEDQTGKGDVIGTPGGGTLSYFIEDRVIVNLDGLMNSKEYFDDLRRFDTNGFMNRMGIKYIYANEYAILNSAPYSRIFKDRLTLIDYVFGKSIFSYK